MTDRRRSGFHGDPILVEEGPFCNNASRSSSSFKLCLEREREREKLELLVIYYIHEHSVELNDIYIFCSTCGSGGEITLPTISCKIIQGPVLQKQVQQTQDVFSLSGFPEPNSGVMDNL